MLNLWNRVIKNISDELKVNLTQQEETLFSESRNVDPEAYDAYLLGLYYLDQFSPLSALEAMESFEKAIEIEPEWAAPYGGLSDVGGYLKQMGYGSYSENIHMIYENLTRALELDPNSIESLSRKAQTAAWTEFDWEKAEREYLKALEVNPSHVRSHSLYAHVLTILRRTDEALYHAKISVELDPENPFTLGLYVMVLVYNGKCQEALYYLEKGLSIDPDHYFLDGRLMEIYECLGDYEKAFESWKEGKYPLWEEYGVAELFEKVFQERGWIAVMEEAIRVNEEVWEKDGYLIPIIHATKYFTVGKYDKVMDYYEMVYENNNRDPNLPYISAKSTYDKMKGNQRYLALLKKMNLPVSED
jgi:tetratricopeptide (TPR) repeat protein